MLVVLPPSETKAPGGAGAPLDLGKLGFPGLNPAREEIARDLVSLCAKTPDEALEVLRISGRKADEVALTAELFDSPTAPALERYTGVLFDALDQESLPESAKGRLAVGSALFGLERGLDPIPFFRLSGQTKLPKPDGSRPTMRARFGTLISEELARAAEEGLVVDLRSGTYRQLGRAREAVTVRVETERDGARKVVSHDNKRHKGLLARALALAPEEPADAAGVADIARQAGFSVEGPDGSEVTLVV